jgi:hypothetical protein
MPTCASCRACTRRWTGTTTRPPSASSDRISSRARAARRSTTSTPALPSGRSPTGSSGR